MSVFLVRDLAQFTARYDQQAEERTNMTSLSFWMLF